MSVKLIPSVDCCHCSVVPPSCPDKERSTVPPPALQITVKEIVAFPGLTLQLSIQEILSIAISLCQVVPVIPLSRTIMLF